jgi:XRE family transcriptional regulator, regulator of sulfur utilization
VQTLKNIRSERRLSLAELSARTGVSAASLWEAETGKSSPTLRTLERIARGLNVRVEDLLYKEVKPSDRIRM